MMVSRRRFLRGSVLFKACASSVESSLVKCSLRLLARPDCQLQPGDAKLGPAAKPNQ